MAREGHVPPARLGRCCPICGSVGALSHQRKIDVSQVDEFTYSSRKVPEYMHYEYRRCASCDLVFSAELPDFEQLLEAYGSASFDAGNESDLAARAYMRALKGVLSDNIRSVLDVGCGDGAFMRRCLLSGANRVVGIEPSRAAARSQAHELSESIFVGSFEDFDSSETFDLICLFQTIEHLVDPVGFLAQAQQYLTKGGRIAVACHDYSALPNRILGTNGPIFDIEHLQLFSKISIARAMTRAGLTVESIKPYTNTYPLAYWIRLAPFPKSVKIGRLGRNFITETIRLRIPVGNIMAIARML